MLKQLFGGLTGRSHKADTNPQTSTQPDNVPLPVSDHGSGDDGALTLPPTLGFVSHQPVMDRNHRVVAYEFMVRHGKADFMDNGLRQREFDQLMLQTLLNMDIFQLLAFRRAFVHISISSLDEPQLEKMPQQSVIFVLNPVAEEPVTPASILLLEQLKRKGFRFALEPAAFDYKVLDERMQPELFNRIDFMILDFAAPSTRVLAPILDQLPRRYPSTRWMARNMQTAEDLDVCLRASGNNRFALFHGPFVASVRKLEANKVDTGQTRVLQLMRLLRANAEAKELEAQFKLDSVLLFKLLRFINSPVNALTRKVHSIEDSLLLLGRETLFKWLSMLLFTARREDGTALALLEKSLIRGRLLERLGRYKEVPVMADQLFLVGMFSLLDVLLNIPFPDVLNPLGLPEPVYDALTGHSGVMGDYLALAICCEQGDHQRILALCSRLGVDEEQVSHYYMESVIWTQEVLKENDVHNDVDAV